MDSPNARSKVALLRVDEYSPRLLDGAMAQALQLLGVPKNSFANQRLLIKPNLLVSSGPDDGICTHPEVVGTLIRAFGPTAREVLVGDSPAIGSCFRAASRLGLDEVCARYGAELVEFQEYSEVPCPYGAVIKRLPLATQVLTADALITCAKLKTHGLTAYTGAVKNLYGCIPGMHKAELHLRLQDIHDFCGMLIDLYQRLSPKLAVIDGIVAMEGAGPRNGKPKRLGVLIVSQDAVAADAVACQIIGLNPQAVIPLKIAQARGLGQADPARIDVLGASIDKLKDPSFKTNSGAQTALGGLPPFLHRLLQSCVTARPVVDPDLCRSCGICEKHCPPRAITMGGAAVIDYTNCIRCYCCQELCPHGAIELKRGIVGRMVSRLRR